MKNIKERINRLFSNGYKVELDFGLFQIVINSMKELDFFEGAQKENEEFIKNINGKSVDLYEGLQRIRGIK